MNKIQFFKLVFTVLLLAKTLVGPSFGAGVFRVPSTIANQSDDAEQSEVETSEIFTYSDVVMLSIFSFLSFLQEIKAINVINNISVFTGFIRLKFS